MSTVYGRRKPLSAALAWTLLAAVAFFAQPARADEVSVSVDEARIMKLPDRVATIVIGTFGVRVSRTTSDFLVASRSVSPLLNASAIGGEYLSAASFLGIAGLVIGTVAARVSGDSIRVGPMPFTLTPRSRHSSASPLVICNTPPFEAR